MCIHQFCVLHYPGLKVWQWLNAAGAEKSWQEWWWKAILTSMQQVVSRHLLMTSGPRGAILRCIGPSSSSGSSSSSSSSTSASSFYFSSPSVPFPNRFAWRVHPLNVAVTNVLLAALRVVPYLILSLSIFSRQEAYLLHALVFLALVILMHLISPSKRLPSLLLFTSILILYSTIQIQSAVLNQSPFVHWYHTGGNSNISSVSSSPDSRPFVDNETALPGTFHFFFFHTAFCS